MNALEVEDLRKSYRGGKAALDGVSLAVPEGSFFALLGPNGAGKSTLINILADVVRPSGGRARLFGRDMFAEKAWCKRRLGVVPQEVAFDPFFTPREILRITSGMFGARPDARWIEELLDRLELSEHAEKNSRQLSGGMRRRLLVAQALVHRPRLVVLDEPTAGVDVELRKRLWVFMRELNAQGTTILLTTHYLEEAQELCDRVAIIDRGRVRMHSTMRALLQEAASRVLRLCYAEPLVMDASLEKSLAAWHPVVRGSVLELRLVGEGAFDRAYRTAADCFGAPKDVDIVQEDLEDVFLRLTGGEDE